MKKTFDLLNINSIQPVVRNALHYKETGSALDLGCGIGRHALFLAKKGFRVIAVDERTEVLTALKELARLQKLHIIVRRGNVVAFESKRKFDLLLSTMVIHFLAKNTQKKAIIRMQQFTKKDGINVISSYTDKNKKGTRPHLVHAKMLKKLYKDTEWNIRYYKEELGKPMSRSSGKGLVRYWTVEIMAQKK